MIEWIKDPSNSRWIPVLIPFRLMVTDGKLSSFNTPNMLPVSSIFIYIVWQNRWIIQLSRDHGEPVGDLLVNVIPRSFQWPQLFGGNYWVTASEAWSTFLTWRLHLDIGR